MFSIRYHSIFTIKKANLSHDQLRVFLAFFIKYVFKTNLKLIKGNLNSLVPSSFQAYDSKKMEEDSLMGQYINKYDHQNLNLLVSVH